MRLGDPPATGRVLDLLAAYPGSRFKLDPTSDWDEALVRELAALDAVETVDLKGAYRGTIVDQPADTELYRSSQKASRARGSKTPTCLTRKRTRRSSRTVTGSPGTRSSIRSPMSRRCRSRPAG